MANLKSRTRFSPEMQLLLLTAKSQLKEEDRAKIRKLAEGRLDWNNLIKLGSEHRTLSLMSVHLRDTIRDAIPPAVFEQLQIHFQKTVQRNLLLAHELIKILKRFRKEGVEAIPLKGPMLAMRYYQHIGYRSFLDLDILVTKELVIRCAGMLEELGYVRPASQTGDRQQAHLQDQLGFDFRRSDGKILVELHWALIQKWLCFHLGPEDVWGRLSKAEFGGFEVPVLSVEDNLLFLCAHGAKHQWERIIWIADLAEVIRTERSLDWERLLSRARQIGSKQVLLWGIHLAHDLLGAEIPVRMLKMIRRSPVTYLLSRRICRQLAAEIEPRPGPESKSELLHLFGKDRLADKCTYAYHMIELLVTPTVKDRQFVKLPEWLSGMYFLFRPVRVIAEKFNQGEVNLPPN